MQLKEIKERAAQLKNLPMGFVNQKQLLWLTNIDSVTYWRLPAEKKPDCLRIGGAEMCQLDAAIRFADEYWTERRAREEKRGHPYRVKGAA
jgi:hypothetical protein